MAPRSCDPECQEEIDESRATGWRCAAVRIAAGISIVVAVGLIVADCSAEKSSSNSRVLKSQITADDPLWGCGLLGALPGISQSGETSEETQRFIDSLKKSSSFGKVTFWNWNLAPQTTDKGPEYLSKDFLFMPEVWGANVVDEKYVRTAGESNFPDSDGRRCPAEMANIFMGMNEPDIQGSCMGNMFGRCVRPCTQEYVQRGDCPAAYNGVGLQPAQPNERGMCNCWEHSVATGVGFWPLNGCQEPQPLPDLWTQGDWGCIKTVINNWRETARIAVKKGYKYLTTPLLAVDVGYAENFIKEACQCGNDGHCACTDASCGCPVYVGLHFYAFDCEPVSSKAYETFQGRVQAIGDLMEKYPFLKGAIINEVGMLNCAMTPEDPICVPDSGKFPAKDEPDHGCPTDGSNPELPDGLATFIADIVKIAADVRTSDGRPVVKSFSWFNIDRDGGTYNLRLFKDDGSINKVGEAYMQSCEKWGEALL